MSTCRTTWITLYHSVYVRTLVNAVVTILWVCKLFSDDSDCFFFFFFQAEDGIRDKLVTGVQTCALPISLPFVQSQRCVSVPLNPLNGFQEPFKLAPAGRVPQFAQGFGFDLPDAFAGDRKSVV